MPNLKPHDKVEIIDKFEQATRLSRTTGTIVSLGGYDESDDVVVKVDGGGFKHLKAQQVIKIN